MRENRCVGSLFGDVDQAAHVVDVDQVSVVRHCNIGAVNGRGEDGLNISPVTRPGRGVARVPDSDVTIKGVEEGLVKNLRDQPLILIHNDPVAVAYTNTGAFLATVLEGEKPKVR